MDHAVADVGDALAFAHVGDLEVVRAVGVDPFEEASPFAEQGGDDVELDLVEDAGFQRARPYASQYPSGTAMASRINVVSVARRKVRKIACRSI